MWAKLEDCGYSSGRCFCVARIVLFKTKILNLNTSNQMTHSLIHLFTLWLSFARDPDSSHVIYMPGLWMCLFVQVLRRNIEYVFSATLSLPPHTLWSKLPLFLRFSGPHASLETFISQVVMVRSRHFKWDRSKHPTSALPCCMLLSLILSLSRPQPLLSILLTVSSRWREILLLKHLVSNP